MAEQEINYASVVFKAKTNSQPQAKKDEETVYDEVKMQNQKSKQTADTNGFIPVKKEDHRHHCCQRVACFLGILCVILMIGIIVVCIFLAPLSQGRELDQFKNNITTLVDENHNLTALNRKLMSENENLKQNHSNLTVKFDNLTQVCAVLEGKLTILTEEKENLTRQNQNLETKLKQIQNMKWNESQSLNVSRAQWSIDAYCRIPGKNGCQACQKGWILYESSCYAFNNAGINQQRNWKEAQDDCREKISDLVVILDEKEKKYLTSQSWTNGEFWIGLRVEDGRWKWVDGRNLTENSWIKPAEEGHCAISVQGNGWRSVKCSERNQWICEKEALSV